MSETSGPEYIEQTSSDAQWSIYRQVEDQAVRENMDPPYPGPQRQQVRGVPEPASE